MKVVITGCEGYIGSALCTMLKGADNIESRLSAWPGHAKIENPKLEIYPIDINQWDIRCPLNLTNYISSESRIILRTFGQTHRDEINTEEIDCVVHLAALVKVGESVQRPWDYYDTNINGTKHVIDAFPNAKIIYASTGAVANPTSPYARSKEVAEDIVRSMCDKYTIFRFFNVGGNQPTNPEGLYQATQNAIKSGTFTIFGNDYDTLDGTCVRDYIHVLDLCDAIHRAIVEPSSNTKFEPIGSGKSYTVEQYIKTFLEVNGPLFKVVYGYRRPGDNSKSEVPWHSSFTFGDNPLRTLEEIVKL
jgi:UDP-glucose 4-epimerase